jgi:pyruvate/2-oxoglutarate dehydrogenase complex dihydrolipoamide dehydrogenase (E3) component
VKNPEPHQEFTMEYQIVVIGAGSGGLTAALTAAGFGKKVLLIDKSKPGGECTWSGCIPSKALIHQAKQAHLLRCGASMDTLESSKALEHVHRVRETVYSHETPEVLAKSGVDYLNGEAGFIDGRTIEVGENQIRAKTFIISTGSSPFVPPLEGLEKISYLTNESIFELKRLPGSMIVLGGGPVGVELSQAINRLGTRVTLVEMMPNLVFREEKEFSEILENRLSEEGVVLKLGFKAVKVSRTENGVSLVLEKSGRTEIVAADAILVAVGRRPNTEGLRLERAGVDYNATGIKTNDRLQTSRSHVYAIGDVAGPYPFSHMANVQGIQAVKNAIFPIKRKMDYRHVAWVTFSDPELARAGLTEAEARKKYGDGIRVYPYDFNQLDRAITAGETMERIKVILDRKGFVLGVSILAERAGEMIGEIQLLRSRKLKFAVMANVIHPYPTYSDVFSKIGKKVMVDNLLNNPVIKSIKRFL